MPYEFLPHTADILVQLRSATWEGVLCDATDVVRLLTVGEAPGGGGGRSSQSKAVQLTVEEPAELLFMYLRELLYWFESDGFVPTALEAKVVTPTELQGRVWGEPFDPTRHGVQPEIKAVTRHALLASPVSEGWRAEVLFDV